MGAYYNEIDPKAAAWLRELIKRGLIAPGEVDERSIVEVRPDDLRGFTQCHFFAGIGVWSYALRRAGWSDDRPVWTGSCPCQPFSVAGKGDEFADERHLWPAWFRLIRERRPVSVFGEQVSSKDALSWLDYVRSDLESAGYAVGVLDTCAAGVGAPHIRQRFYFVADSAIARRPEGTRTRSAEAGRVSIQPASLGETGRLALADGAGCGEFRSIGVSGNGETSCGHQFDRRAASVKLATDAQGVTLGDTSGGGCGIERHEAWPWCRRHPDGAGDIGVAQGDSNVEQRERPAAWAGSAGRRLPAEPSAVGGYWSDADWISCTDGKARPTEPGTFPLVTGAAARVVRLRGYGNAINAEQARCFIEAFIEVKSGGI